MIVSRKRDQKRSTSDGSVFVSSKIVPAFWTSRSSIKTSRLFVPRLEEALARTYSPRPSSAFSTDMSTRAEETVTSESFSAIRSSLYKPIAACPTGEYPESASHTSCSTSSTVGRSFPRSSRCGKVKATCSKALRAPELSLPVTTSEDFDPNASGTIWIRPSPGPRAEVLIRPLSASWSVNRLPVPTKTSVGCDPGLSKVSAGRTSGTTNPVDSRPSLPARSGNPSMPEDPGTSTTSIRSGMGPPPKNPSVVYRLERSRSFFAPSPGLPEMGPGGSGSARPCRRITGPLVILASTEPRPG